MMKKDVVYTAARLLNQFKRAATQDSLMDKCWKVIEVPLNFLRDYTVPMAEYDDWNRFRATVLPLTVPVSFMYLQGYL